MESTPPTAAGGAAVHDPPPVAITKIARPLNADESSLVRPSLTHISLSGKS
jgi:hypothetical protein